MSFRRAACGTIGGAVACDMKLGEQEKVSHFKPFAFVGPNDRNHRGKGLFHPKMSKTLDSNIIAKKRMSHFVNNHFGKNVRLLAFFLFFRVLKEPRLTSHSNPGKSSSPNRAYLVGYLKEKKMKTKKKKKTERSHEPQ
jgi:hypothetical protein